MRKTIRAPLLFLLVMGAFGGRGAVPQESTEGSGMETDVAKVKEAMLGNCESIVPEIRPSKNPDGSLKPFYLKRSYKYLRSDRCELEIVNSADPYGAVPLARIKIGGHMRSTQLMQSEEIHDAYERAQNRMIEYDIPARHGPHAVR